MRFSNVRCASYASFLVVLVMLFLAPGQAFSRAIDDPDIALLDRTAKAFSKVVKGAMPAVVGIQVEKTVEMRGTDPFSFFFNDPFFERFFGPHMMPPNRAPRKRREHGLGSGFIVSKDGYILTNNHVVGEADVIKVKLADGRHFKAKVVGTDPDTDVAVIKVDADGDLPTIPLGDSDSLNVGEWVIAIGNPFGLAKTVTVGIVSAKGRSRIGINDYEDFIQTDAAINPGNSGGPLINIHGEVVGINTAIFSKSGGYMGIGFAIPINMAKAVMDQIITKGKVVRGWLGVSIQDLDEDLAASFGISETEGALISLVIKDSPADKGGLEEGDIILSMGGHKIKNASDLRNRVALTKPGKVVTFEVFRKGKRIKVKVKIAEKSKEGIGTKPFSQHSVLKKLGLSVQDLDADLAEQFGYEVGQGVLIAHVDPDSPAAQAGLKPGQLIEEVNRVKVRSVKEFLRVLSRSKNRRAILFKVRYGEFAMYVSIRLR